MEVTEDRGWQDSSEERAEVETTVVQALGSTVVTSKYRESRSQGSRKELDDILPIRYDRKETQDAAKI